MLYLFVANIVENYLARAICVCLPGLEKIKRQLWELLNTFLDYNGYQLMVIYPILERFYTARGVELKKNHD